ncbi:MAG: hypothetical protein ABJO09_00840 [Hyphomicrobiales bacterium]
MARISSVHPGLFTGEGFMSLSVEARMLFVGLWCKACDDGVFAWKQLTLKARIFPVDNVDIGSLLSEISKVSFIQQFSSADREYGAIRNFQRPKKPNESGVLPAELRTYVGSSDPSSEPVLHQYGKVSADGGWRR